MNLLQRFLARVEPVPETRALDGSWDRLAAHVPHHGGTVVHAHLAENLSTVLAAVNLIATSIASLPVEVQRRRPGGGFDATDNHPLARLLRDGPNRWQSWPDFVEWLLASTLLAGNGLAEIARDNAGRLSGLVPIPWSGVQVQQLQSGRIIFDVTPVTSLFGRTGPTRRLLDSDVLWLRDRTDDGIVGRSRLHRAAGTLSPAWELQQFTGALFRNGVHPSGVLTFAKTLSEEARKFVRGELDTFLGGSANAGKFMLLDNEAKWQGITVAPHDAELLASRRFSVEELARLFGVPPNLLGDLSNSSFTNAETMVRFLATTALSPWIVKLEHEVHRSLFSEAARRDHRFDIDLSGLLRGDPEMRWASHKIAIETQVLTVDEVREIEGYAPRGEVPAT